MATILIVEDDPKIVYLLQTHLAKYSYAVVSLKDFAHVLEEFQAPPAGSGAA